MRYGSFATVSCEEVFGAIYPLRALVMRGRFSGPYFGRIIGLQALFVRQHALSVRSQSAS